MSKRLRKMTLTSYFWLSILIWVSCEQALQKYFLLKPFVRQMSILSQNMCWTWDLTEKEDVKFSQYYWQNQSRYIVMRASLTRWQTDLRRDKRFEVEEKVLLSFVLEITEIQLIQDVTFCMITLRILEIIENESTSWAVTIRDDPYQTRSIITGDM